MSQLLRISFLLITAVSLAQNFNYLGDYTADGTPLYLEKENDVVTTETLQLIANSLPESFPVPVYNPHYISSGYDTDIILHDDAEVYVTFVAEGAGYKNVLGFYTYDIDKPLNRKPYQHEITIVFPNVSAKWSGGSLEAGNKVKLGSFKAGTGIGWVLLADAWKSEVTWGLWQLFSNHSFNPEAAADLKYHNVLLNDPQNQRIILGFEDIRRDYGSCDNDFNDALFYVTANPYSALETKNYADVDSATKVNSAYDGGLESNGDLASLIAKRNLQRSKNPVKLNKRAFQSKFSSKATSQKNGKTSLGSYFPETAMFGTESASVSSPEDLMGITNAAEVFAVDYYSGSDRVAAGLLLETEGRVYDHSKTICDRLNGSSLEDVRTFRLAGHEFILAKIKRVNRDLEYAVSFSVNQKASSQTLFSYWNIDQYPTGDYLNFQIWGKSVGQVSTLINHILETLNHDNQLQKNTEPVNLPSVFVKSGYYDRGALYLNIMNKIGKRNIVANTEYHKTELDGLSITSENITLSGILEEQLVLETGYLFDAGVSLYDTETNTYDALYLADGPWGIDYNANEVSITDFKIKTPQIQTSEDNYPVERGVVLEAGVKGTLNIFRHILAGALALNVSDLSAVEFNIQSNTPVEVILVPADLENWENRLRYTIPANSNKKFYAIPFEEFKDASGNSQPVTAIRSVVFSIHGDYVSFEKMKVEASELAFSTNKTLRVEEIIQQSEIATAVSYPNPFTDYTIIKVPENTSEVVLTLVDMNGRKVAEKKEKTSGRSDRFRVERDGLASGYYNYMVTTDSGNTYKGKLLIN
ncbi:putative secreted protein (Por secretion system target) [Leeuwenhoekiella aestuarii]|uniref:Putative secreted protein (Por secretion system target) n=1 Tax=Leeuwenhoekiella aestuarii TaxID=2249426 RepID=A0A4V1KPG6_9FLAO|nr:DUF4114 domain-containing protein [Leeuwenhoekiella aestuarii]RXG15483.1 putative secreted protein (Por secretion system target) [Leeuwenhoekiella aestuarii]RXG17410.1 putative secreted protein (Por secretion system target) [Leeuwenhoekiella aestuarii]